MSNDDYVTGIDYPRPFDDYAVALCTSAARYIRILSPRLDPAVFDNEEIASALGALARDTRQTQVRILIRDPRNLLSSGHRLVQLARRTPSNVQMRKLAEHPDWNDETIVIKDMDGVLYKHGDSDSDAFHEPSSRAGARRYLELFDELWRLSEDDPDLRSMHI
jgi:hypothetical protein